MKAWTRVAAGLALAAAAGYAAERIAVRRMRGRPDEGPLVPDGWRPAAEASEVRGHDGARLHAIAAGSGPTLVLSHGVMLSTEVWPLVFDPLVERGFRVVAYDQRGHGRSGRAPSDDYRIERFGADLNAILQACVPDGRKAVVAGHSLGGMSIVSYAGLYAGEVADRVAAAALVNTGMGDLIQKSLVVPVRTPVAKLEQRIGAAALSAPLPLPSGPTPLAHRAVKYVALSADATPAQVGFSEELVIDCRPDVRGAIGGALTRLDLHAAVERLDVPTLVIAGDRDRLTPPEHAERLHAELPRPAGLVRMPGGHMGPIEHADEVTRVLRDLATTHLGEATDGPREQKAERLPDR